MSVFFLARESGVDIKVGEYQEFPKAGSVDSSTKTSSKLKFGYLGLVLLSFGLLCILQAILNISLRLTQPEPAKEGGTEVESCPQGWILFYSSCYYISNETQNWDRSRKLCLQRDADLVIINSRQEQAFLTGFAEAAWVGMTDRMMEGVWVWVDGTLVDMKQLQWARGQPDRAFGGEDCGNLFTRIEAIGLNDYSCQNRLRWICEKTINETKPLLKK